MGVPPGAARPRRTVKRQAGLPRGTWSLPLLSLDVGFGGAKTMPQPIWMSACRGWRLIRGATAGQAMLECIPPPALSYVFIPMVVVGHVPRTQDVGKGVWPGIVG